MAHMDPPSLPSPSCSPSGNSFTLPLCPCQSSILGHQSIFFPFEDANQSSILFLENNNHLLIYIHICRSLFPKDINYVHRGNMGNNDNQ